MLEQKFIKDHGINHAWKVINSMPETATHFTEALGGHYAKEGMLKMKPQWLWFNRIDKQWYFDFAAKEHIHLPDLKRLLESIEIIERVGYDLDGAKQVLEFSKGKETIQISGLEIPVTRLEKAIEDFKSIYEVNHA